MKKNNKKILELLELANNVAGLEGVTIGTLSNRLFGWGGFFARLADGSGCTQQNYEKALKYLKSIRKKHEDNRDKATP